MTENTTNPITADDLTSLEREMQLAHLRHRDLARESSEIARDIEETTRKVARQMADCARSGESTAGVLAELDLDALRERQKGLPLEIWAASLAAMEAEIGYQEARRQHHHDQGPAVRDALKAAQEREKEAKRIAEDALVAYDTSHRREMDARSRAKAAKSELVQLEANYPGAEKDAPPVASPRTPTHAERVEAARSRQEVVK